MEVSAQDRLNRLGEMMYENHATLAYGSEKGCRCMSCKAFTISWEDDNDTPQVVGNSVMSLGEVIDAAWARMHPDASG